MPPAYTPSQRGAIAQFVSFTSVKESVAAKVSTSDRLLPRRQSFSVAASLFTSRQTPYHPNWVERKLTLEPQHLKTSGWNVEQAVDAYVSLTLLCIAFSTVSKRHLNTAINIRLDPLSGIRPLGQRVLLDSTHSLPLTLDLGI